MLGAVVETLRAATAATAAAAGRARLRPVGALDTPRDLPPFLVVLRPGALGVAATAVLLFAGAAMTVAGATAFGARWLRLGPAELLGTPVQREEAPTAYQFLHVSIASLSHQIKLGVNC